jgi:hypothetical protein
VVESREEVQMFYKFLENISITNEFFDNQSNLPLIYINCYTKALFLEKLLPSSLLTQV